MNVPDRSNLQRRAYTLGVNAELGDDPTLNEYLVRAIEEVPRLGLPLPPHLTVTAGAFVNEPGTPILYHLDDDAIYINPVHPLWVGGEVYAGLVAGRRFPDAIMRLYRWYLEGE